MDKSGIAYKAVANFVGTVDPTLPKEVHVMNVWHDAWLYDWNSQTVNAMMVALNSLYEEVLL